MGFGSLSDGLERWHPGQSRATSLNLLEDNSSMYMDEHMVLTSNKWLCDRARQSATGILKPRHIASPCVTEAIIQKDKWKRARFQRGAARKLLDNLPWSLIYLM